MASHCTILMSRNSDQLRARRRQNNRNQRRFKLEYEAPGHDLPCDKPTDFRNAVVTVPQLMGQPVPQECKGLNEKQDMDSTVSEEPSTSGESSQVSHGSMIDVLKMPECGGNTRAGRVGSDPTQFTTGGSVTMC